MHGPSARNREMTQCSHRRGQPLALTRPASAIPPRSRATSEVGRNQADFPVATPSGPSRLLPDGRQSRNRPIRRPQARLSVPILELITSSFQLACDPPRNPTMLRTPGGQTMICRSETASREGLLPDTRQLPTSILPSRFQDSFLQRRLPIQHNREGYRSA